MRVASILAKIALAAVLASSVSASLAHEDGGERRFEVGSLLVEQTGDGLKGQPLIFIPGLFGGAWSWTGIADRFAAEHEVFVVTLPGFSGREPVEGDLLEQAVANIARLVADEGLERPVLVGHSMGAYLAIRVAVEHPDAVGGVIAVDGFPVFPPVAEASHEERVAAADRLASQFADVSPQDYRKALRGFIGARLAAAEQLDGLVEEAAKSDQQAVGRYLKEFLPADLRPDLGRISAPVLAIAATDSYKANLSAPEIRAYYDDLLTSSGAKVVLIRNARHFVGNDQPEALGVAIETFLAGQNPPATR